MIWHWKREGGGGLILPVSLEYNIGGGKFELLKFRCRGYFVLLNKCKTKQMRLANTAMPVVTLKKVGRSDVNVDISDDDRKLNNNNWSILY